MRSSQHTLIPKNWPRLRRHVSCTKLNQHLKGACKGNASLRRHMHICADPSQHMCAAQSCARNQGRTRASCRMAVSPLRVWRARCRRRSASVPELLCSWSSGCCGGRGRGVALTGAQHLHEQHEGRLLSEHPRLRSSVGHGFACQSGSNEQRSSEEVPVAARPSSQMLAHPGSMTPSTDGKKTLPRQAT